MKVKETVLWLTISPSGPRAPTDPIIPLQPYLVRKQTLPKAVYVLLISFFKEFTILYHVMIPSIKQQDLFIPHMKKQKKTRIIATSAGSKATWKITKKII